MPSLITVNGERMESCHVLVPLMNPRTGVGVLSVNEVYRTVIGSAVLDRAVRARS